MKKVYLAIAGVFMLCASAQAVPVLQIGAPAGIGDIGTYADYLDSLSDPTEDDTAVTSGSLLYVAGVFQNQNVVSLGTATNWSSFTGYDIFEGNQAILMATFASQADALASGLTISSASFLFGDGNLLFPNNHAPLKPGAYSLYYDIGAFTKNTAAVPDFADESGSADGEIKNLTLALNAGFASWIHFDVMAIEATEKGQSIVATYDYDLENNPGSHDVTWKDGGDTPVPEPATMLLFGTGIAGLAALKRRTKK